MPPTARHKSSDERLVPNTYIACDNVSHLFFSISVPPICKTTWPYQGRYWYAREMQSGPFTNGRQDMGTLDFSGAKNLSYGAVTGSPSVLFPKENESIVI